jgi:hypothetical protein
MHPCRTTISKLFRSFCDASLAFIIRSHYSEAAPPNDPGTRQGKIRFIQVKHEEAAALAACGYTKWTGMETSDRSERYVWTFWRLTRSPGDKEKNNKNANPTISRKRGDFLKARMCQCAMAAPREMLRLPKRRMPSERRTILLLRFEHRAT